YALGRGIHHRLLRIMGRGKEPNLRPATLPIPAQLFQQPRREQSIPVLVALALNHANLMPLRMKIGDLEMTGFIESQPGAVDRHQKRTIAWSERADRKKLLQFTNAEYLRPPDFTPNERQHSRQLLHGSPNDVGEKE